jgi:putative transposase
MRYTTFRFALDPTPAQEQVLARHAGASRFACNQCLELVVSAIARTRIDPSLPVPWTRFDLVNAFNAWKRSEDAGRVFVVDNDGSITKHVTGLAWRGEVSAEVFEEAAVDLGRALQSASPGGSAEADAATASDCGAGSGRTEDSSLASGMATRGR